MKGVDVLAVMDTLADGFIRNEGTDCAYISCKTETKPSDGTPIGNAFGELREARAAVAELIEAAQAYAEAESALANREFHGINAESIDRLQPRVHDARRDLESALARVTGDSSPPPRDMQAEYQGANDGR